MPTPMMLPTIRAVACGSPKLPRAAVGGGVGSLCPVGPGVTVAMSLKVDPVNPASPASRVPGCPQIRCQVFRRCQAAAYGPEEEGSFSGFGACMTTTHAADATAHDELVEQLDAHVRAVVRREGVDPQRDAGVVRRIAEGVVRDHDEASLTGVVAPVPDVEAVVGELVARVSGFGPLQPFLDDPAVEELWINSPDRVFVARHGRHELTNLVLTRAQVQELVERMLKSSGRRIDLSRPFVDAMLPEGHRLHVVLEGISRGFSAVNVRKFVLKAARLSDLVELGSLTPAAAAFLEASVRAGLNILVAGGTQTGKTTMLNCLAAAIPGSDRVVSAEEVFELRFPHPDWVPM